MLRRKKVLQHWPQDDIELQKERDREEFEAMRAGAIDAIFAAEFAAHGQDGGNDNDEEQVTAFLN